MASYGKQSVLNGLKDQVEAVKTNQHGARKNAVVVGACVLSLLLLAFVISRALFGGESAASVAERGVFVDSQTGEVFEGFAIPAVGHFPYKNPKTGTETLYPAEACFWAKDGTIKAKPTYVLLNELVGKPGQTMCPDCGRPVKRRNPYPVIDK
ncbi:MAG: hypothetical protein K2Q09_01475 [Phycisphaerales bacterium]|nr:hypothetical protein [Phycisphaerales bacterium]